MPYDQDQITAATVECLDADPANPEWGNEPLYRFTFSDGSTVDGHGADADAARSALVANFIPVSPPPTLNQRIATAVSDALLIANPNLSSDQQAGITKAALDAFNGHAVEAEDDA